MRQVEAYSRLAGVYDEIVVDPCFPSWAEWLDRRWRTDGVHRILDVCCGTGLMADQLVARGYAVTGVDASEAMLARARTLLGPGVDLVRATLPSLPIDGVYDAAVSTFDGLNYLDPADFRLSLVAIAARLRPGGWLTFDLHTDAMLAMALANPVIEGDEHGHAYVIRSFVDVEARTCDAWIDVLRARDGDPYTEHHRQYFHSDGEVRSALQEAGFELIAVTDEYTDRPVDPATLRASWTARRTAAQPGL